MRIVSAGAILAVSLLFGCSEKQPTETTRAPGTESPTSERWQHVPPDPNESSIWQRRDAPPDGIRSQIAFYGIGDRICSDQPGVPSITRTELPWQAFQGPGSPHPELGQTLFLCLHNFVDDEPIRLSIRGPGSFRRAETLPPSDAVDRSAAFWLTRTWPLGRYVASALQGNLAARLPFRVVKPQHFGVRTKAQPRSDDHGAIDIMVIGQPPRKRIVVDVYRNSCTAGGEASYATSFALMSDAHGIAEARLKIGPRDQGSFLLKPRSGPGAEKQDAWAGIGICDG